MSVARFMLCGELKSGVLCLLVLTAFDRADGQAYSAAPVVIEEESPVAPATTSPSSGPSRVAERRAAAAAMAVRAAQGNPASPSMPPGVSGPTSDKPSGKPDDAKKDAVAPVRRKPAPAASPNRDELKVRPDAAGEVRLCFNNQPWQPVLEWLATISHMSLDWQELPGDTLNLTTQRSYKVAEVRDLINHHLLARGYTLLCQGETMSVADIKKLDPSLVPRVEPADLAKCNANEFVKVSFSLDSFPVEAAENELKPNLSPNGRLKAMNETNRLEAMDAVVNLREIDAVLRQQQARANRPRSFRTFKLKHARAEDVVQNVLRPLLRLDSPKMPGMPGQPGMDQQQAMMMARAQGNMPGQPQPNGGPSAAKEAEISLAINAHNNSILVQASPEKMPLIAQAIEAVDVPADGDLSMANMSRMQVYRLSGIDPEPVVKTLKDLGNLDPTARLDVDKKNSAIIAYAPLADHVTIRALVEKLTGSERTFQVIRLRRLAADAVAGTIERMLGGTKKENSSRSSYYMMYNQPQDDPGKKEFHVEADVEFNRLLLWANPVEMAEIDGLLVKLGEMPAAGSGSATVRVIDGGDEKERQELIERIRRVWPSLAPNELSAPTSSPPATEEKKATDAARPAESPRAPANDAAPKAKEGTEGLQGQQRPQGAEGNRSTAPRPATLASDTGGKNYRFTNVQGSPADEPPANHVQDAAPMPPPVKIAVGPDGKLVISSQDLQALDMIESLAAELPARRKDFFVFHLKYALASSVATNLEDFFKEKKDDQSGMRYIIYDSGMSPQNESQEDRRLSKRRKLKFISDVDTNTILVEGADGKQLKTIDELIQVYDQPPPSDSQSVRKTELIHLNYAKAKVVADTIKDVYRDLLSANDKALNDPRQGARTNYTINYGSSDTDSTGQKTPRFKGLLSIGIDENSNSLVVSAPAFLFDHVNKMIGDLDGAAAPKVEVRVVRLGSGLAAERMKDYLDEVYNGKEAEKQPAQKPTPGKPASKKPGRSKPGSRGGEQQPQQNSGGDKDS